MSVINCIHPTEVHNHAKHSTHGSPASLTPWPGRQVPANSGQMSQLKMSAYHCYQWAYINDMDSYLALDATNGIESAAIMWGCTYPILHMALASPAMQRLLSI